MHSCACTSDGSRATLSSHWAVRSSTKPLDTAIRRAANRAHRPVTAERVRQYHAKILKSLVTMEPLADEFWLICAIVYTGADGGAGDDDIDPGAGADVIIGGEGADDVSVDPLEMDGDLWTDFAAQDELGEEQRFYFVMIGLGCCSAACAPATR